jgi:hypothetical protein
MKYIVSSVTTKAGFNNPKTGEVVSPVFKVHLKDFKEPITLSIKQYSFIKGMKAPIYDWCKHDFINSDDINKACGTLMGSTLTTEHSLKQYKKGDFIELTADSSLVKNGQKKAGDKIPADNAFTEKPRGTFSFQPLPPQVLDYLYRQQAEAISSILASYDAPITEEREQESAPEPEIFQKEE